MVNIPLPLANVCNSYVMCCPHVRGDNPRAFASGLSHVQVDKHGITFLYPWPTSHCRPFTSLRYFGLKMVKVI